MHLNLWYICVPVILKGLKQLTVIQSVDLDYEGGFNTIHLDYGIEPNMSHKDFTSRGRSFAIKDVSSKLGVSFDAPSTVVNEIAVQGVSYSAKTILKMRIKEHFSDNDYVWKDLVAAIDDFEYDN